MGEGLINMAQSVNENELSPLDQIRQTEAEVTRRIAAAREAAELNVVKARTEATHLKNQAREAGNREGQIHYKEIITGAGEEAEAIIKQARRRAEDMRRKGHQRMPIAVKQAMAIIIGADEDVKTQ
jgi:vacuolar-type H+-ATPase subunit H